jgi:hypothetical protein
MSNAATATSSATTNPTVGPREATKKVSALPGDLITHIVPTPVATETTATIEAATDQIPMAEATATAITTITIKM